MKSFFLFILIYFNFSASAFNEINGQIISEKSVFNLYNFVAESTPNNSCENKNKTYNLQCKGTGTTKGQFTYSFINGFENSDIWRLGFDRLNQQIKAIKKTVKRTNQVVGSQEIIINSQIKLTTTWDYSDFKHQVINYRMIKI